MGKLFGILKYFCISFIIFSLLGNYVIESSEGLIAIILLVILSINLLILEKIKDNK